MTPNPHPLGEDGAPIEDGVCVYCGPVVVQRSVAGLDWHLSSPGHQAAVERRYAWRTEHYDGPTDG